MKPLSFFDINSVLRQADLKEGEIMADFGCGSGHFVLAAAKIVGSKGKVYAIDVQKSVLSYLKNEINRLNLPQIKLCWADLEKPERLKIPHETVDLVLISSTLHQIKNHKAVFLAARQVLKEEGRLLIIDWRRKAAPFGPPVSLRLDENQTKKETEEAGFKIIKEIDVGAFHFGFLAKKE